MRFQPSEHSTVFGYGGDDLGRVDTVDTVMIPGLLGVRQKSHVNLNTAMKGFLSALRPAAGFDLVVTSGVRTPASQASAMLNKLQTGGSAAVTGLYGQKDLAQEVVNAPRNQAAIQKVIEAQVARGRYISDHMRGDGIDLRIHGLNLAQRTKLKFAARGLGAQVIDEGDHIHVEGFGSKWAVARTAGTVYLVGGVAMTTIGLAILWRYRDEARTQWEAW